MKSFFNYFVINAFGFFPSIVLVGLLVKSESEQLVARYFVLVAITTILSSIIDSGYRVTCLLNYRNLLKEGLNYISGATILNFLIALAASLMASSLLIDRLSLTETLFVVMTVTLCIFVIPITRLYATKQENKVKHFNIFTSLLVLSVYIPLYLNAQKISFYNALLLLPVLKFFCSLVFYKNLLKLRNFSKTRLSWKYYHLVLMSSLLPLTNMLFNRTDILMLSELADHEQVFQYGVILRIYFPLTIFSTSFAAVILTKLGSQKFYASALYWILNTVVAVCTAVLFIIACFIFSKFFADDIIEVSLIYLMSFTLMLNCLQALPNLIIFKNHGIRKIIILNICLIVVNVVLNLYFIERYGAMGCAIATATSQIIALSYITHVVFTKRNKDA